MVKPDGVPLSVVRGCAGWGPRGSGAKRTARRTGNLATMPSREEIFAKLLFLINAPAQRLVTVMNAVGRDVAVVINQAVKEKKFKEGEAATA